MAATEVVFACPRASRLVEDAGAPFTVDLSTLAPWVGGAPAFFDGWLSRPRLAATLLLTVAAIARSRCFRPISALLLDPILTSGDDRLRLEAFSSCCRVYARADLLPDSLRQVSVGNGTTNVDCNQALRAALALVDDSKPMRLTAGAGGIEVATPSFERRVAARVWPGATSSRMAGFAAICRCSRQHFDIYASPSGDQFDYMQADAGSVTATTENRVTRGAAAPRCRTATLSGTYVFNGDGFSISGSASTPIADAGFDGLDAAGHDVGIISTGIDGAITRQAPFTGTYTVAANCTGSLTAVANSLHFDIYVSPHGDRFVNVETDPGVVKAEAEQRVASE